MLTQILTHKPGYNLVENRGVETGCDKGVCKKETGVRSSTLVYNLVPLRYQNNAIIHIANDTRMSYLSKFGLYSIIASYKPQP